MYRDEAEIDSTIIASVDRRPGVLLSSKAAPNEPTEKRICPWRSSGTLMTNPISKALNTTAATRAAGCCHRSHPVMACTRVRQCAWGLGELASAPVGLRALVDTH